jgi:hypothetical protein
MRAQPSTAAPCVVTLGARAASTAVAESTHQRIATGANRMMEPFPAVPEPE